MIFNRYTIPCLLAAVGRVFRQIFFRGEPFIVGPDEHEARLEKCNQCEYLVPDSRQCVRCTCFVDVKTLLSTESCPEKYWTEVR